MADGKIKSLKRKYLSSGSEVKAIYDAGKEAISDPNDSSKVNCFKGLFRSLNKYYEKCDDIWEELFELHEAEGKSTDFPDKDFAGYRSNIRKYYVEASTYHELVLQKGLADETNISKNVSLNETGSSNQLPKMNLPSFNGELIQWPKFRDIFTSLIHNDETIPPIRKFHYLMTSLSGSPLSIVNKLPLTADNYSIAWKALVEAFDNKRILASSYLNELVNFKSLQGRPSVQSLKFFLSRISENISAFKLLSIPNESDFILYHLAIRRLDPHTREQFEIENQKTEFPTFEKLSEFIRGRCLALQLSDNDPLSSGTHSKSPSESYFNTKRNKSSTYKSSLFTSKASVSKPKRTEDEAAQAPKSNQFSRPQNCPVCGQPHKLLDCIKFTRATAPERFQWLKSWSGCRNCLSVSHATKNCSSKWHCRFCEFRHHSLLHLDVPAKQLTNKNDMQTSKESTTKDTSQALSSVVKADAQVMLGTAVAHIKDARGHNQPVRIVIDSGSQSSFITQRCLNKLGLPMSRCSRKISGIGCSMLEGAKGRVTCSLTSVSQTDVMLTTEAVVVKKITSDLPMASLSADIWKLYTQFTLADPMFWNSGPIDFLLGSDLFAEVITGSPITVNEAWPKLFPTVFGHVVIGRFLGTNSSSVSTSLFCNAATTDLRDDLHRFWELEEPTLKKPINNPEDELCEKHFQETHYRNEEGRYVVSLPFKGERPSLSDSVLTAKKRFQNLENKLEKQPSLKTLYCDFMQEYLDLGHMSATSASSSYVIPHHSVTKEDRSQIKLRVVFDASSSTSKGSLNDHLMVGPKLQTDIKEILLGFRKHNVVFVCDVVKMYRNILVNAQDRPYQHILWRFYPEECIQKFELNTLTYVMSCSPFLALRVIRQLKEDEGINFPQAASVMCRDMYVDDLVTGAPSLEEALTLQTEVIEIMEKGGFTLSKWASNHPDVMKAVSDNMSSQPINLDDSESGIKILGLVWKPENDCFSYKINPVSIIFSKRAILSTIAKLYDPLGFISPVIVKAKIILQELWKAKIGWDEEIPRQIKADWEEFVVQLPRLSDLNIKRYVCQTGNFTFQVIGFCDASSKAYSATLYLRTISEETTSMLLISKTKLAPVKTISIPRLELCGALLLSKLFGSLKDFQSSLSNKGSFLPPHFFTDSSVVLGWLNTPAFKLKTFVANRVTEILEKTPVSSWHHVRSEENPSDCSSRGILPQQLLNFNLWWNGPSWLIKPAEEWHISAAIASELPEMKSGTHDASKTLCASHEEEPYILTYMKRFSSFSRFIHVIAWCLRWINNIRITKTRKVGPLSATETHNALSLSIKLIQKHHFGFGESTNTKTAVLERFKNLSPFFDGEGIVRVGGRLSNATLSVAQKHPTLLPNKCHFTNILIDFYHKIYLHPGPHLLQALIQLRFWVPSLRRLVRSRVFLCILCYKSKANTQSSNQYMSDLPKCRFQTGQAFLQTGVDFAGPFLLKESMRRKAIVDKAYLCLYICMATKAVHLELVTSLSTDAFLASFSRFISRRGIPHQVYSDCGTNFVGAANRLKQLYTWFRKHDTRSSILQYTADRGINWNFNPPNAPHFGGLWEANIKSAKRIITKIAGNNPMTYEELSTLFTKTEAILNSRPLHPLSSSPEETDYLSPGHFLIGNHLLSIPSPILVDHKENTLTRWQLVQKMSELFWRRWTQEYLCTLQRRSKWLKPKKNLAVGDVVLLKDSNAPVLRWPLARIKEVHPGKDGLVRVVTIKTGTSSYQRPVTQIVPLLPLDSDPHDLD